VISTPRFLLRPLTVEDATERYSAWFSDETAAAYIAAASAAHRLADLQQYIAARAGREDVLFLGIFAKGSGEHIGNIKYEPVSVSGRFAVMGILIGEKAWRGKGVAEETILASANYLHERHGIATIFLGVHKSNAAARTSYEKAGFRVTANAPFPFDPGLAVAMKLDLPAPDGRLAH
jgi:[ribosomal protein S5]-alanine N-acetyltransferase